MAGRTGLTVAERGGRKEPLQSRSNLRVQATQAAYTTSERPAAKARRAIATPQPLQLSRRGGNGRRPSDSAQQGKKEATQRLPTQARRPLLASKDRPIPSHLGQGLKARRIGSCWQRNGDCCERATNVC